MKKEDYAGFWIRLLACAVDFAILGIVQFIITCILLLTDISFLGVILISCFLWIPVYSLYEIIMTSKYGGTLGKLFLRLKVVDENNSKLTMGRSTGRYFAKILSAMTIYIGYFIIAFTEKKQGLHDYIVKTLVINDKKAKFSEKFKKITKIITIVVIVLYILYYIIMMSVSLSFIPKIANPDLNRADEAVEACSSYSLTYIKNSCELTAFSKMSSDNQARKLCDQMQSTSVKDSCLLQYASKTEDAQVCSEIHSIFTRKNCIRYLGFQMKLKSFFGN